jgi:hypothetical protein
VSADFCLDPLGIRYVDYQPLHPLLSHVLLDLHSRLVNYKLEQAAVVVLLVVSAALYLVTLGT